MRTPLALRCLAPRLLALAVILGVGSLAGVRADDAPGAPPAAPPAPPAAAPARPTPTLTLLEAGAEPRSALRLKLAVGHKEKGSVKMSMSGTSNGTPLPLPNLTMNMAMEVVDVNAKGEARYSMAFGDVSVDVGEGGPPGMKDAMDAAYDLLKRATFGATVTARGETKDVSFQLPDDAPEMMKAALAGTMDNLKDFGPILLPEEPVGVGARWKLAMTMTSGGLTMDQTMLYTLTSRQGDRVELAGVLEQTGKPQEMKNPMLPEGLKMELVSSTATGTAAMTFDLTRLAPVQGKMKISSKQAMKLTMGENAQDQDTEMEISMDMSSEALPATTTPPK